MILNDGYIIGRREVDFSGNFQAEFALMGVHYHCNSFCSIVFHIEEIQAKSIIRSKQKQEIQYRGLSPWDLYVHGFNFALHHKSTEGFFFHFIDSNTWREFSEFKSSFSDIKHAKFCNDFFYATKASNRQ